MNMVLLVHALAESQKSPRQSKQKRSKSSRSRGWKRAFLLSALSLVTVKSAAHALTPRQSTNKDGKNNKNFNRNHPELSLVPGTTTRRAFFLHSAMTASGAFLLNSATLAGAAQNEDPARSSILTTNEVAKLLRAVPTFSIVDKGGVPYMVVGEDAVVTGYFFTTYDEAARILKVARKSADKAIKEAIAEGQSREEIGENPWKKARISAVPMDFAITLGSKSTRANFFRISPAEKDIEDALIITGKDDLAEGKVPLFYFEDFKISIDGVQKTPLYFRKAELEGAFKKKNRESQLPEVKVTELSSLIAELVRPGNFDKELKSLVLIPPTGSLEKQKECDKKGGSEPPFVVGQRIIVL
jgi:hypothetical protein